TAAERARPRAQPRRDPHEPRQSSSRRERRGGRGKAGGTPARHGPSAQSRGAPRRLRRDREGARRGGRCLGRYRVWPSSSRRRRPRTEGAPADDVQVESQRRRRGPHGVRTRLHRYLSTGRGLRGQDSQGRKGRRLAGGAAAQAHAGDQHETREGARPHDPAGADAASGRDHRVTKEEDMAFHRRNLKLGGALVLAPALALSAPLLLAQSGKTEVHWLGQATFKITTPGGKVIVIDPFVTGNPKTSAAPQDLAK